MASTSDIKNGLCIKYNNDIYKIVEGVKKSGRPGSVVGNLQELMTEIEKVTGEENVILILSNGTCLGLWESDFVKNLKK